MEVRESINKYPIHWALGGNDHGGGLEQNAKELAGFCDWLKIRDIKTILEIGLAKGLLNKFLTIELGLQCDGITLHEERLIWRPENLIIGSSYDKKVYKKVGNYDLIFVDGDHDNVKKDFNAYKKKCKYMAFHDILGLRGCEKVAELWAVLKKNYFYWEFIDNTKYASGIGIIRI